MWPKTFSGTAAATSRASGDMDDEVERLLHDIFMAYALPYGVVRDRDDKSRKRNVQERPDSIIGTATVDGMDEIGWQQLCFDCKLDEDSSVPPARPVFKQLANGDCLEYAAFVKVLKTVARLRYGEEGMVRLLYFKVGTCLFA